MSLDAELEEAEIPTSRSGVDSLDSLVKTTNFTKKELKIIYRGFKQVKLQRFKFKFNDDSSNLFRYLGMPSRVR